MMMRLFLMIVFCMAGLHPALARADSMGIAAVVDQGAITADDVNARLKLVMVSSGMPSNPDIVARITPQIVNGLIDEELRLQEADRLEISVSDSEIDSGFKTIAEQNNMSLEQFREVLRKSGINPATMERQIRSQLAWTKVVQSQIRPQINVSDSDVEAYLARLQASKGKSEYLLAEIYLPVEKPEEEGDMRQLANRLVGQISSGAAPFFRVAQQFSKAAGAAQGGDIGWVQEGQLPEELDGALSALELKTPSAPIRSVSGYHILLVRDKRIITDQTLPERGEITNIIGSERLERQARRYFLDMKSQAFIENRVNSAG